MKINTRNILLLILAAAFFIRFCYFLTLGEELIFPDSARYDRIAAGLAAGEGFESGQTAPLYPLFLSGVYAAFGRSFFAVRIMQALIECFSVLLVFVLAKEIFSRGAGLFAAGIFSVYPFFIFFSGLILTETLSILLLLTFIYLFRKFVISSSIRNAALCGAAGGAAILLKPVIFYFIPLALLYYIISEKGKRLRLLKRSALLILLVIITASPWTIYNYIRHGTPEFLSASSITLYESFNPHATGGPGKEKIEWTAEMEQMDRAELERYFRREAIRFIINNPGRAVRLAFIKQGRFWSPIPNFSEYRNLAYGAVSFVSYTPLLFLALWMVASNKKEWKRFSYATLPIIFFALVHTVMLGSIRYRIPVDPFIIILASGKISDLTAGKNSKN